MNMPTSPKPAEAYHPPVLVNGEVREPLPAEVFKVLPFLNDYFLDHRYVDGWSDEEVSRRTGLPRVLVQKVRLASPDHGEISVDPEVPKLWADIKAAEQLIEDIKLRLTRVEQKGQRQGR